jgi:hypothetical protein
MLKLPDGSKVEVFGPDSPISRHFTTGPVAGFLVDDVQGATAELRRAGADSLLESEVDDSGNAWAHFRAPDGNIYEFTEIAEDRLGQSSMRARSDGDLDFGPSGAGSSAHAPPP